MTRALDGKLAAIIDAHRDVYTSLLHLAESLTPAQWSRDTGCPGWSVKDVFSHVAGLESIMAGDPEPDVELPAALEHVKNDFGRYMERHVEARRPVPIADLLLEAREVFSRRLGQVEAITDLEAEVTGVQGASVPAYRALPIRVFDMWAHEQDIRRAVDAPGHLEGPAVELTLDRIEKALVHVLGGDEDVSGVVELEATGAVGRRIVIDTDAGELLDGGVRPAPRVRLVMPLPDLVSRVCGREDAPPHDLVLIEGDRSLADAVFARLAFTP